MSIEVSHKVSNGFLLKIEKIAPVNPAHPWTRRNIHNNTVGEQLINHPYYRIISAVDEFFYYKINF